MDTNILWEPLVLILSGILLFRIAGRKSISQMTMAQTVVMISIGTIIVQPVVQKSVLKAIIGAGIFILAIVILEYVQIKSNAFEKFITGKSKIVIQNGLLNVPNLKKLRLTVDQLEMRLRNSGISRIEDVKTATIEPNGQLGYELKDDAKPLTMGEFKKLMNSYFPELSSNEETPSSQNKPNLFEEMKGKQQKHPKYLQ